MSRRPREPKFDPHWWPMVGSRGLDKDGKVALPPWDEDMFGPPYKHHLPANYSGDYTQTLVAKRQQQYTHESYE